MSQTQDSDSAPFDAFDVPVTRSETGIYEFETPLPLEPGVYELSIDLSSMRASGRKRGD